MNDKEAIEYLKTRLSLLHRNYQFATEQAIETVLNLIEKQKAEIEKKDLEIVSLEKTHNYDVKMIDEVKGEAVKLYKEIEILKRDFKIVDHECSRLEQEDIKKDKIINLMENEINKLLKDELERIGLDVYLEKENITIREFVERKLNSSEQMRRDNIE